MISRQWRGLAKIGHAENYVRHLNESTFPKLLKIKGFVNAAVLRRKVQNGIEFLVVTNWQSMRAIEQFAGSNPELAVVPKEVQKMMIEFDHKVRHYEVVGEAGDL
jgi:heme-degrading monooxygenase HmoA